MRQMSGIEADVRYGAARRCGEALGLLGRLQRVPFAGKQQQRPIQASHLGRTIPVLDQAAIGSDGQTARGPDSNT